MSKKRTMHAAVILHFKVPASCPKPFIRRMMWNNNYAQPAFLDPQEEELAGVSVLKPRLGRAYKGKDRPVMIGRHDLIELKGVAEQFAADWAQDQREGGDNPDEDERLQILRRAIATAEAVLK